MVAAGGVGDTSGDPGLSSQLSPLVGVDVVGGQLGVLNPSGTGL